MDYNSSRVYEAYPLDIKIISLRVLRKMTKCKMAAEAHSEDLLFDYFRLRMTSDTIFTAHFGLRYPIFMIFFVF